MRADQKGFDRVEGANSAPKVEKKNTEIDKTTNADVDNTLHRNIGVKDLQIQQPGANRYKNTLMRRLIDPPSRQADKIMGREGHLATKGFDFGTIWPGNLPGYEHWQQQYDEYERRTVAEERLHPEPYDPKPAKVSVRPIVIGCGIMIATCFFTGWFVIYAHNLLHPSNRRRRRRSRPHIPPPHIQCEDSYYDPNELAYNMCERYVS